MYATFNVNVALACPISGYIYDVISVALCGIFRCPFIATEAQSLFCSPFVVLVPLRGGGARAVRPPQMCLAG